MAVTWSVPVYRDWCRFLAPATHPPGLVPAEMSGCLARPSGARMVTGCGACGDGLKRSFHVLV